MLTSLTLYLAGAMHRGASQPEFPPVTLAGPHQLTVERMSSGEAAPGVLLQLKATPENTVTAQLRCHQGSGDISLRLAPEPAAPPASWVRAAGPLVLEVNGMYVQFNAVRETGLDVPVLYAQDAFTVFESVGSTRWLDVRTLEGVPVAQLAFETALKEALMAAHQQCAPAGMSLPGFPLK